MPLLYSIAGHGSLPLFHLGAGRCALPAFIQAAVCSALPVFHHDAGVSNNNNNNLTQRRYSRFFTISSQRCKLSPTCILKWPGHYRVQITCNTSSAYHVQVSCYVPLGMKGQLSCWVWQSWNRIYLSFILLARPLNWWKGEETGVPGENPWQRASENATYYSLKIQAPSETRTCAAALVAG